MSAHRLPMVTCLSSAHVLVVMTLIFSTLAKMADRQRERGGMEYADCGTEDKAIHFDYAHATPMPVIVPGTLYVTLAGNLTSELPRRVNVYINIKKYFFGFPFSVPCFTDGIGSCSYENICRQLEPYEAAGCPKALRHFGIPCHCPFSPGHFNITHLPINVPKIHGLATTLVNGDYQLELRIIEEDGPELGCLRVNFSLKKRHRGWLFKI